MSNLNFDSNKIKKKWKELYNDKDKIISFLNNFDRSNSKFASKVYIEESKKKQNIENDLSSPEDNITENTKVSVEEDNVNQDINQDKNSESKINDQEEIIPIEPKFNLEQVEAIKKEAEELGKKHGYIDGKKLGFEQGHSKGLIEGEEKGLNKGKLAAIEEAESKANEKVQIVLNELKQLFESAKEEFNKTEIIENVCRLSLHIAETICRGLHHKNPNQLIELIKFNLSKIMPDDNKLVSVFVSQNDFDNYGSIIQEKLPYKILPHSEISNGVIRIKIDENQYEDNFHNNLLSIAKDILSRDDFEKYQEEKSNSNQSFDKPETEQVVENANSVDMEILKQNKDNLIEDNQTLSENAIDDEKSKIEEVVENANSEDMEILKQNKDNLIEGNQTLSENAIDDEKSITEEVAENEDDKNSDQNMNDMKEEKPFLDKNLIDTDISMTSGLHQKISTDLNLKPDSNNENINGNDLEEVKENSNSKISDNDNNKS